MSDDDNYTDIEWALVISPDDGESFVIDGMPEDLARKRLAHWRNSRPRWSVVLRRRKRYIVVGDWEEA